MKSANALTVFIVFDALDFVVRMLFAMAVQDGISDEIFDPHILYDIKMSKSI